MAKPKRILRVTWGDAHGCFPHWRSKPPKQKPRRMVSVGACLQDDEVGITLVQSWDKSLVADGIFIPRANVQEVEEL